MSIAFTKCSLQSHGDSVASWFRLHSCPLVLSAVLKRLKRLLRAYRGICMAAEGLSLPDLLSRQGVEGVGQHGVSVVFAIACGQA